jgi:hypothetical protein
MPYKEQTIENKNHKHYFAFVGRELGSIPAHGRQTIHDVKIEFKRHHNSIVHCIKNP